MSVSMSRKTLEIAHVVIESTKPPAHVRAALEASMPVRRRDHDVYEIGNQLTTSSMTLYVPAAALYASLPVIIYEKDDGGSRIEYDLPSSLLGQFGDERVTEVARRLDVELGRVLSAAAG